MDGDRLDSRMKIAQCLCLACVCASPAACHIYVDEPAPRPPPPAPAAVVQRSRTGPGPVPQRRVLPLHLGASTESAPPSVPPPPAPLPTGADDPTSTCLDELAAPLPDCALVHAPDPSCAPFPFPYQKCESYRAYFDPKIAAVAVACLAGLSSRQLCDRGQIDACGTNALSEACEDPTAGQLCAIAATSCKTSSTECASILSGLNDQAKQLVAKCIANGCQAGLYSCVEELVVPP